MIKSEGGSGRDDWKKSGTCFADCLTFDGNSFGPWVEALLGDFDVVFAWGEVDAIIGDCSKAIVEKHLSGFGVAGERDKACALDLFFFEAGTISTGIEDGGSGTTSEDNDDGEVNEQSLGF